MIRRLQNLAWDGVDALRGVFDVVRWPFERVAWMVERRVFWPLRARAARLGAPTPTRAVVLGGVGVLAAGALALGVIRAAGGGEESPPVAASPVSAPAKPSPKPAPQPAEPVLAGTAPDFSPKASDSASPSKVADADTVIGSDPKTATNAAPSAPAAASSAAKEVVQNPGPAAIEVARRFSGAFALYETGRDNAKVRATLGETASPQLTKALLRRPPRLPADVEVPKAKVLNVVPGPRHGNTFTLSASLLRVGVTSELRIDVRRDRRSGEWQVTDVLG